MLGVAFVTVASWVIYSPIDKSSSPNVGTWYEPLARQDTRPWHGPTSWHLDTVAIRWSQPPDPQSDEALGNGITFALHKDFCSRMLGLFPEANILGDFFLSCQDLRNTVKRAMDTWAINHKGINFKDVTESCRDVELKDADSCAAAEIFIVPNDLESRQAGDLAAWVEFQLSPGTIDRTPYTTAGFRLPMNENTLNPPGGLGLRKTRMTVRAPLDASDFCWYFDATFCWYFHRYQESFDFVSLARVMLFLTFLIALSFILWVAYAICGAIMVQMKESRESDTSSEGEAKSGWLAHTIAYLAVVPIAQFLFAIFWVLFCPLFYYRIFLPCYDCYDFEATIAHEVGHVLGFDHPDQLWELNLKANSSMASCARPPEQGDSCCFPYPFDYVSLNKVQTLGDSIMHSMTTVRDRTCLTADDLEGLNYLYPSCTGAFSVDERQPEPLCIKAKRQIGWLRLISVIFLPFLISSSTILVVQRLIRRQQEKQMRDLGEVADRLRAHQKSLQAKLAGRASIVARRGSAVVRRGSTAVRPKNKFSATSSTGVVQLSAASNSAAPDI